MAEEDTPQEEKTEEPTARRLEKAKEEGQVLRSQDMTIAAVNKSSLKVSKSRENFQGDWKTNRRR